MSYRTNRRTGGVFRTKDYTPSELESQSRRYICPICTAMLGHDLAPGVAHMYAQESGHEIAGTPIASFISRAELNQHLRSIHSGQRFPTREERALGRGININIANKAETKTPKSPKTKRRRTKKAPSTMTATEPETPDMGMLTETADTTTGYTEAEENPDAQGFTDDDGQVFDGDGGLL